MTGYAPYDPNQTVAAYSTGPLAVENQNQLFDIAPFFNDNTIYQKNNTTSGNYCNKANGTFKRYNQVGGGRSRTKNSKKTARKTVKKTVKRKSKKTAKSSRTPKLKPSEKRNFIGLTENQMHMLELLDIIIFDS